MSNAQPVIVVQLYQVNCGSCGGVYCITEQYREKKEQNGGGWHCPYCDCSWGYFNNNELARTKKALAVAEAARIANLARANEATAERDKIARKLKRVEKGTCPCCQRSFVNLARHMATKHPEGVTA